MKESTILKIFKFRLRLLEEGNKTSITHSVKHVIQISKLGVTITLYKVEIIINCLLVYLVFLLVNPVDEFMFEHIVNKRTTFKIFDYTPRTKPRARGQAPL